MSTSTTIPRRVLTATRPEAPPRSAARARETMSLVFGVSLARTGTSTTPSTARTTCSRISGSEPISAP